MLFYLNMLIIGMNFTIIFENMNHNKDTFGPFNFRHYILYMYITGMQFIKSQYIIFAERNLWCFQTKWWSQCFPYISKFEFILYDVKDYKKYKLWMWRTQAYAQAILSEQEAHEYMWNCSVNIDGGFGKNIPNDNLWNWMWKI